MLPNQPGSPRKWAILHLSVFVLVLLVSTTQAQTKPATPSNQFLIASDIHFNPMADPALVSALSAANPTLWESILNQSKLTAFSPYGQDTNWWLLQSALDQMQKTLPHPAFIMITGDLLAHNFPDSFARAMHDKDREHYRAFVRKTVDFLALEFRQRFGNTEILLAIGNNDEECGNYTIHPHGMFLIDTAGLARDLAHADDGFLASWQALGSYNVPHPVVSGVRIIGLNTVFFSSKYRAASFQDGCASVPATGGPALLTWLESSLSQAKKDNEKVWLVFHIPPGIDGFATIQKYLSLTHGAAARTTQVCSKAIVPMWVPTWTAQFDELLEKYQGTVIASLAGHTHADDFRLLNTSGTSPLFIVINPPISPIYGQNPAFRVASFTPDGMLADQTTYYLTNLDQASRNDAGRWEKEYTFSKEWKKPALDADSLESIYSRIQSDEKARNLWFKLYNVSRSSDPLPEDALRGFYCAIGSLDPASYEACYCPAASFRGLATPHP
ncbi:MAG: hypothetical protein WCC87_03160 [Candidatus Korobacteraceae bacterium]